MQQYFLNQKLEEKIYFDPLQSHHIKNVMRMKKGSVIKAVDPDEHSALYTIDYEDHQVIGKLKEMLPEEKSAIEIILLMALIKKDKWDFCIQKACECSAYTILPFVSERCVVQLDEKKEKKLIRWQKIASEACEQSKQNHLCEIKEPVSFSKALQVDADLKLIAYENADLQAHNLVAVLNNAQNVKRVAVMIGPEGGFSDHEIESALKSGFTCVSLGKSILRAETAAISALSMLKYHYEILGEVYGSDK